MTFPIRVLAFLLARSKGRATIAALSGATSGLLAGVLIGVLQRAATASPPSLKLAVLFAVACAAQIALNVVSRLAQVHMLHESVLPELRVELVDRFLHSKLRSVERAGDARLIGALTEDTAQAGFAVTGWTYLLRSVMATIACAAYMLWLSPMYFVLTAFALAVGSIALFALSRPARARAELSRKTQERSMQRAEDLVSGVKELKLSRAAREDFLARAFEPDVRTMHREQAMSAALQALGASWMSTVILGAVGALLFTKPGALAHGALTGYAFALVYLGTELTTMSMVVPVIRTGELTFTSIEALRLAPESTKQLATSESPSFGALELRGVTHAYEDGRGAEFVLGPVDFRLARGEIVFLVGGNGGGKSTLAKVLLGLYAPDEGQTFLDDRELTATDAEEQRSRFSAVLAKWHLFDRLFGLEAADLDERANEYLVDLRLAGKVTVKGGVFSALALSQGQRKRLALVTALLEDRPAYVFDEWAADQDPEFKETFYRTFLPELKRRGKSAVVVTHDSRYFDVADRVVRLERGKIT